MAAVSAVFVARSTEAFPPAPSAAPAQVESGATLARAELPAKGRAETILTVSKFGRYAIVARSAQGAALQLVDRMAGPGIISGVTGSRDGRLDMFLDRGEYKVVVRSDEKGTGSVALTIRPFADRSPEPAAALVEQKPVEAALGDFEQRSWWIEIKERRSIALEAAGRNLADLRLWREGSWLVDAAPETEVITPSPGQPLLDCRLSTDLEPGLYRLAAYGGPSQDWAVDSPDHPLHLRFGIPELPEAGRRRFTTSAFGVDRYVVPGIANYFRLELPQAREASIQVAAWAAERPFENGGARGEIRKSSLPPVAELDTDSQPGTFHSVVIRGAAGQPYVLQHFETRSFYRFDAQGRYWISTIHSGDPADSIDATAIVMRYPRAGAPAAHLEPIFSTAAPLDPSTPWARRFNLLERGSVFLDIREAGAYEAVVRGTAARIRIEPFFLSPPEHYESPPFQQGGGKWELEKGIAVLTIEPVKKGIVELVVRAAGAALAAAANAAAPGRPAAIFPDVPLDPNDFYSVSVNDQPGVRSGLVVRPLPLDLTKALPVAEAPAQAIDVSFSAPESGTVRAEGEDGAAFPVSVDGGAPGDSVAVAAGTHMLTIRNAEDRMRIASVSLTLDRLAADAPLPAIPAQTVSSLPAFPVLSESAASPVDLDSNEKATYLLRAQAPALYRVETTGLLATAGTLRTRTNPSFRSESGNGTGRNFLIQEYLREGEYQLTVAPAGASRGHAGVVLSRTAVADRGVLLDTVPARATLPAGRAVAYRFSVPRRAEYRLRALGLGHTFRCRLETADGWPVDRPAAPADIVRVFEPGDYRLVILPEPLDARVVTVLARRRIPRKRSGHGPHFLPLDRTVSYEWRESEPRAPDRWNFSLPAPAEVTITLTDEMTGAVRRAADGNDASPLASVAPAQPWKGRLAAGKYRLDISCARTNDRVRYRVSVVPTELVAGLDRDITAPAAIPLSVGTESLVRLSSFGSQDVRARLLDASGRLLAAGDDRADDWNFEVARRLTPGLYRLEVETVGTGSASSTISMEVPREIAAPSLALPSTTTVRPGRAVRLFPLEAPAAEAMLLASARSLESVAIAVEGFREGTWTTLAEQNGPAATIAVPVPAGEALRLRLWSVDRRGGPAEVSVAAVSPAAVAESRLVAGAEPAPVAAFRPPTAVLRVTLERPGTFRLDAPEAVVWSPALDRRAVATAGLMEATGTTLWLARVAGIRQAPARIAARRVRLAPGTEIPVEARDPATVVDLERHDGPIVAIAATTSGTPALRIDDGAPGGPSPAAIASAGSAAIAVSLAGDTRAATVWSAQDDALPIDARLGTIGYAVPRTDAALAHGGNWNGSLARGSAASLSLPAGRKSVRVALEKDLAAALSSNGHIEAIAWSRDDPAEEEFETESDTLTLFNLGAGDARASASALSATPAGRPDAISFELPFESNTVRREVLHRAVEARAGEVLHVRGRDAQAVYVSASGKVRRGTVFAVDAGRGALAISHAPGPLLCWIERSDGASGAWGATTSTKTEDISPPAAVALRGSAQTFHIAPGGSLPRLLHLRSASPAVARIGKDRFEAFPDGIDIDLPVGEAEMAIALRGFAGQTLSGTLEIESTPVTAAAEGLGAAILVAPGGTRGFAFRVNEREEIGLGVRASSEAIDAELVGPGARRLGSGIVQMLTLDPGTYVLVVRVPRASAPVLVRPAIAGLERPGTGPPADVIARYLRPEADAGAMPAEEPVATRGNGMAPERGDAMAPEEAESAEDAAAEGMEPADDAGGSEAEPPPGSEEPAGADAQEPASGDIQAPPPAAQDEPPPAGGTT